MRSPWELSEKRNYAFVQNLIYYSTLFFSRNAACSLVAIVDHSGILNGKTMFNPQRRGIWRRITLFEYNKTIAFRRTLIGRITWRNALRIIGKVRKSLTNSCSKKIGVQPRMNIENVRNIIFERCSSFRWIWIWFWRLFWFFRTLLWFSLTWKYIDMSHPVTKPTGIMNVVIKVYVLRISFPLFIEHVKPS